jgi:hypothetical protein
MTDISTYSDSELQQRLGAAVLDDDVQAQALLKQEQDRRTLQPLADAERARREAALRAAEADALIKKLVAEAESLDQQYKEVLVKLSMTPPADAWPVVEEAYTLGRQKYSLCNDLVNATGHRRFATRDDVPDQLELYGGQVGKSFILGVRGRPPVVPTPWSKDIERLREIYVPTGQRIGNGG